MEKQITQMLHFKAKITPNKTATKTAKKKCFLVFYTVRKNCDSTMPYNKSLINLVCSVCMGKYCLRFLYENLRQYFPVQTLHSVNKSLVFFIQTILMNYNFKHQLKKHSHHLRLPFRFLYSILAQNTMTVLSMHDCTGIHIANFFV